MNCPYNLCFGTGFIRVLNDVGEEEFKPCKCRFERIQRDTIKKKRIEARIPVRYWGYTFENYKNFYKLITPRLTPSVVASNNKSVELIESYINEPKKLLESEQVLWIWGTDDNSCHTSLAIMIGDALLNANIKVVFLEFYKLMEAFNDFDNKIEYLKELENYQVYIIDDAFDITRCHATNYRQTQMFGFLNDILNENKHIISTSNVSISNIDSMFNQIKVILSRSCRVLNIQGSFTPVLQH